MPIIALCLDLTGYKRNGAKNAYSPRTIRSMILQIRLLLALSNTLDDTCPHPLHLGVY